MLLEMLALFELIIAETIISKFVRPMRHTLITNIIGNLIFLVLVFFNTIFITHKLLIVYYLFNNMLLIYGIIKLLNKINSIPKIIVYVVPNLWNNINTYLMIITVLFISLGISIVAELNLDLLIYCILIIVTIYFLSFRGIIQICTNMMTIFKINNQLRIYCIMYIVENLITFFIYFSIG